MLSSCTHFKAMHLGTWGVWNCDFLGLSVQLFFLVLCRVIWGVMGALYVCAAHEENSLYSLVGRLKLY